MKLINARIQNFQSFRDSGTVEFHENINLIVGQNNAGKSALLRALLPTLAMDPHRSPEKWEQHLLSQPQLTCTFEVSGREIEDWCLREGRMQHFPVPRAYQSDVPSFMRGVFEKPAIRLIVSRTPATVFSSQYPSHQLFQQDNYQRVAASMTPTDGRLTIQPASTNADDLPYLLTQAWNRDMFYFHAERMTIGEAPPGHAERLAANASNLPNVLHTLSNERGTVFQILIHHVREIFPTVGNISIPPKRGGPTLEVRIWPTEEMEQVELSFPLNSSGTGVAQVIALLTVIMTMKQAVIIIDEINSFLHPAAVKTLLRIIQSTYPHHQYIISTHAPEVISFSNPKSVHLVKRMGYESTVEELDIFAVEELRELAEHLGVSMADVFAAERVIWVEGPTEELCFPYLYQETVDSLPKGTIFTSVVATGDFNAKGRTRELVYEVYSRLSAAASVFVVDVAFSFDSENLAEHAKQKMKRQAKGQLHFLPRRHFECYLLEPGAILAFIISKDSSLVQTLTAPVVAETIKAAASERPFWIQEWNDDIANVKWLGRVDAANLIRDVCGKLSGQRVTFGKKDDSLFLLRHILKHNPDAVSELKEYVASLVATITRS